MTGLGVNDCCVGAMGDAIRSPQANVQVTFSAMPCYHPFPPRSNGVSMRRTTDEHEIKPSSAVPRAY